jgi:hypothetical protein
LERYIGSGETVILCYAGIQPFQAAHPPPLAGAVIWKCRALYTEHYLYRCGRNPGGRKGQPALKTSPCISGHLDPDPEWLNPARDYIQDFFEWFSILVYSSRVQTPEPVAPYNPASVTGQVMEFDIDIPEGFAGTYYTYLKSIKLTRPCPACESRHFRLFFAAPVFRAFIGHPNWIRTVLRKSEIIAVRVPVKKVPVFRLAGKHIHPVLLLLL